MNRVLKQIASYNRLFKVHKQINKGMGIVMKKLLAVLVLCLFVFSGCSFYQRPLRYSEAIQKEGVMLEAHKRNWGANDYSRDFWCGIKYVINYDGTMTVTIYYNLSGEFTDTFTLSKKEYMEIYEFAFDGAINHKYDDIEIRACDGTGWTFTYTDSVDSEPIRFYYGYIYGVKDMEHVEAIVDSYARQIDVTLIES